MPAGQPAQRRIAIIGSGFSGLCLGIQLKQAGIHSFTIYEKSDRIGGTWRDNVYPGAACDVPAFAYCYSFEQKTDWSEKWAPQEEILAYIDHCAEKYGILPHVRFGTEIAGACFDEGEGVWHLRTTGGEEIVADVVASGVGQLNRPSIPPLPGLETFRGERFHSARWNHAYDLRDKTVAVVGNAASAVQFIPRIAPETRQLYILQRSPNWILARNNRRYGAGELRRFARHPWLTRLYRWWLWLGYELRFPIIRRSPLLSPLVQRAAERYLDEQVADPGMRAVLRPDYPVGAKRLLISDDYYAALARSNVELVTSGIDHFTETGVVMRDGRVLAVDCVILATGFDTTSFLAPMTIEGRGGRSLHAEWAHGARAYLGLTVAGFPNFFMMYGPNTNLGHNSIIFMIECQTRYILDCLHHMDARDLRWIDVRPEVMASYNARLQRELAGTAWAATGKSWYKTADGTITNNWPGTTVRYWLSTLHANLAAYETAARASGKRPVPAPAPGEDAAAA